MFRTVSWGLNTTNDKRRRGRGLTSQRFVDLVFHLSDTQHDTTLCQNLLARSLGSLLGLFQHF